MDNKIKLIAVASIVAVVASGCSGYRNGANQQARSGEVETYNSQGSGQVAGGSQVSRGGLFGQRRPAATCAPCAAKTQQAKSTYTYKPAPKPVYRAPAAPKQVYRAPARPAGQHTQQWYVDRWKRQQAAGKQQTTNKNYSGYGGGNYNYDAGAANNTNYYDYSTAGQKKANTNNTVVTASNKSIYTGSYQQKTYQPYKPTTYAGGSAASTNTTTTYSAPAASSSGGSGNVYIVKKGDTVFEIMRQTGVYWKDIIKLNNLVAPYNISPGQRIRLK